MIHRVSIPISLALCAILALGVSCDFVATNNIDVEPAKQVGLARKLLEFGRFDSDHPKLVDVKPQKGLKHISCQMCQMNMARIKPLLDTSSKRFEFVQNTTKVCETSFGDISEQAQCKLGFSFFVGGFACLVSNNQPLDVCQSIGDCDADDLAISRPSDDIDSQPSWHRDPQNDFKRAKQLIEVSIKQQFPVDCLACNSAIGRIKPLVDDYALESLGFEARHLCEQLSTVGSWTECDLAVSRMIALIFRYVHSLDSKQVCEKLDFC